MNESLEKVLEAVRTLGYRIDRVEKPSDVSFWRIVHLDDGRSFGLCEHSRPIPYWSMNFFCTEMPREEAKRIGNAVLDVQSLWGRGNK